MVIPVETLAELDKLDNQATPGNAVGRFFKYDQIEKAKKDGKFDDVRRAIKEIEDIGGNVYYICTTVSSRGGKWLYFTIHNVPDRTGSKLLALLTSIARDTPLEFNLSDDITPLNGFASGGNVGSPSACPLF